MDKEKIITIVIGLVVGGILAGAYFMSGKFMPTSQKSKQDVFIPKKTEISTPSAMIALALDKPDDQSTTTESLIGVSGKTAPGNQVVIFANADEKIASAGADGKFMAEIKLEDGANSISVTALNPDGKFSTIKRDVVLEITQ